MSHEHRCCFFHTEDEKLRSTNDGSSESQNSVWSKVFSALLNGMNLLSFSTFGVTSLFYFVLSGLNACSSLELCSYDFRYVSSVLLFICAAAAITSSILYFIKTCRQYNEMAKDKYIKTHKRGLWAMVGIPAMIFELGLLFVGALTFQLAIDYMASLNTVSNGMTIYYLNSAGIMLGFLIGTVTLAASIPYIFSSLCSGDSKTKQMTILLSITFLMYSLVGFSFIPLRYDTTLCMMFGFIAIGGGIFLRDLFHISHAGLLKRFCSNTNSSEEGIEGSMIDQTVLSFMGAGVVFLTIAAVLYQKNPVFINWIDNKPFFNVNFGLFAAGMTLIVIGLIMRSLQNNPNINKYEGLKVKGKSDISLSENSTSPLVTSDVNSYPQLTTAKNIYV